MYQKYTLSNGVRVVLEKIPHVKSVSLGFWVKTGSIHENKTNNGITHFIEHMLFKGTEKRNAKEIAAAIDDIGGQLNAFTSKECTCYYAKVLDSHVDIAVDVLTDMLFHAQFNAEEIEKEKSVVLEEINMYEDSPEDKVHDLLSKTVFDGHTIGFPVLGNHKTVENFQREDLLNYIKKNYTTENMVVSVAGNFNEALLLQLLEEKFKIFTNKKEKQDLINCPKFITNTAIKYKDIEQLHLCIGLEGVPLMSDDYYPLLLMNTVFGGSMSSRLFQNIREDKGLAYSVFSYPSSYKQNGIFTIYAGINPAQLEGVMQSIKDEVHNIKKYGLTEEELVKSKEQLKGNYILGLESTSSRMLSIGKSELFLEKIYSQKEILNKIDEIKMEDVRNVIDKIFVLDKVSIVAVGNIDEKTDIRAFLQS
ncbi:M16 family metallopeptidase [Marinisporobacter balticus]|uniref:Putative Zn-dependent peptidase n=1 Tax=Marinisporobacter balticus TaxID=2018667 RepID=A0A4R2L2L4_9FIRM|nr:pitrilysin family protein [Marinisporobacter balticus]TCO79892.1 putative Zn-dependent peptidase [Marinisporobacter balticus]